jgi:hypothetical protein
MECFTQSVIEKIGAYVYLLLYPDTRKPFYVGKGRGNRVFQHALNALESPTETDKLETIRDIIASGKRVEYRIVRHRMSDEAAFEVESALIDYIGFEDLSNDVRGHHTTERGLMTVEEITEKYNAKKVETFSEPCVLIIINKEYRKLKEAMPRKYFMIQDEEKIWKENFERQLYQITRSSWKIGPKRNKARFALAVCDGLVREIYYIEKWSPVGNRWEFDGRKAEDWTDYQEYIHGDVSAFITKGAQNPIRYVGRYN